MLVRTSYKINDVVTIKLSSGEELIAKLVEESDQTLSVTRPLVFTLNPQNGQAVLIPWLMSVNPKDQTTIGISKNLVITITKPVKEISDNYTQATTGIVTASSLVV